MKPYKRIVRDRLLTPQEAERYNKIREAVIKDFPPDDPIDRMATEFHEQNLHLRGAHPFWQWCLVIVAIGTAIFGLGLWIGSIWL